MIDLAAHPLSSDGFAPYGDVIDASGVAPIAINEGRCARFDDLATLDFGSGKAGISVFDSQGSEPPFRFDLVERHPLGSQAFIPMSGVGFLILVARDKHDVPCDLTAFAARPDQGINLRRNVWHGVLTPIGARGLYAVIDRVGAGDNLQEYRFSTPVRVKL